MKRTLTQRLGLLGIASFLSYTAAVLFAPLAYPGYNWMAQAVSDLSAANAPSLALWEQLSAFCNVCEVVCVTRTDVFADVEATQLVAEAMKENCVIHSMKERDESLESFYMNLMGGAHHA